MRRDRTATSSSIIVFSSSSCCVDVAEFYLVEAFDSVLESFLNLYNLAHR